MEMQEEKLDSLSVIGWRRVATTLQITHDGATEHVSIDPQDLREALLRDGDQSTDPLVAPAPAAKNPRVREIKGEP